MICWRVRDGVHMPCPRCWKIGVNLRNTMSRHLAMNMQYIKCLLQATSVALEGETIVMKFGYWKEHAVVGNGKTLRSRVHMQLEYVMC